jgi:hypothetical protein
MASKELINQLQNQLDNTYGKFQSVMPRALKGYIDEHMRLDQELMEDEDAILDVHNFITLNLIDFLWDSMGDNIGDISKEAKMEFNLGDYKPTPEDKEFSEKETELRERDNEGL